MYNKKFLKTKIRPYCNELTNFHDKKVPKLDSNYICLAVILLDSLFINDEKYYPEVFLKGNKCIEKEKNRLHILLMT